MGFSVINYALQKKGDTSIATGVQDVRFDESGDMVVELRDGSTVNRSIKDIKQVENIDGHMVITYSDNTKSDIGLLPKGDPGESITASDIIYTGDTKPETGSSYKIWIDTSDEN